MNPRAAASIIRALQNAEIRDFLDRCCASARRWKEVVEKHGLEDTK